MADLIWPEDWQLEAIEAVQAFVDSDIKVEIVVGDPTSSIDGTVLAGFIFTGEDGTPKIIHDRTGRSDVFPWALLRGPVLRVELRAPRKRRQLLYAHPGWQPRSR